MQYAAAACVERLRDQGVRISMAATGNPHKNAQSESFCKTLKTEAVYLKEYRTVAEAEATIGRFIDDVYSTKRLHSALGNRPPAEFEALVASEASALAVSR